MPEASIVFGGRFSLFCILNIETGDPPAGWGVRRTISNKEFRTAEVFERNKKMFFTSTFFGSAVHILGDVIADSEVLSADQGDLIPPYSSHATPSAKVKAESSAPFRLRVSLCQGGACSWLSKACWSDWVSVFDSVKTVTWSLMNGRSLST